MRRATRDAGGNRGNGGKWIRPEKRERIYTRDGHRCVWCQYKVGRTVTRDAFPACLDHVLPRERGGSNHESNLVTACITCNARRGTLSAVEFAFTVLPGRESAYEILDRVITAMGTELPAKRRAA